MTDTLRQKFAQVFILQHVVVRVDNPLEFGDDGFHGVPVLQRLSDSEQRLVASRFVEQVYKFLSAGSIKLEVIGMIQGGGFVQRFQPLDRAPGRIVLEPKIEIPADFLAVLVLAVEFAPPVRDNHFHLVAALRAGTAVRNRGAYLDKIQAQVARNLVKIRTERRFRPAFATRDIDILGKEPNSIAKHTATPLLAFVWLQYRFGMRQIMTELYKFLQFFFFFFFDFL